MDCSCDYSGFLESMATHQTRWPLGFALLAPVSPSCHPEQHLPPTVTSSLNYFRQVCRHA